MSKRSFQARQWLLRNPDNSSRDERDGFEHDGNARVSGHVSRPGKQVVPDKVKAALAPFVPAFEQEESGLNKYFIPGWKGESLTSKRVKLFNEIVDFFHADAKSFFLERCNFNRRLKQGIFEEFIFYAEYKTYICAELEDYSSFWREIQNSESVYRQELDDFIDIFCFRVAAIYILKIRFISVLMELTGQSYELKKLAYPNSFLTSLFQKGGKYELKSKALEQNIYSWYRPDESSKTHLENLRQISSALTVTEIVKNISIKSEQALKTNAYSHALSHRNFGLFLNSLLINFPLWLNTQAGRPFSGIKSGSQSMEVVSSKYCGDYLESMALSHWLAQETNKEDRWEQILCPDFKRNDFEAGQYWQLFNELQFLTFLAQISRNQGRSPVEYVSQVASGHLKNRKQSGQAQKSLLEDDFSMNSSTYDRVILNLTEFPKNNSQHFLISKIVEQIDSLKEDGFMYVLSSKKLFVPSQKTKIESLLKTLKVEGFFDLEGVKGKGEVGSYLYIFSKQKIGRNLAGKQSCFTFRLSAQLDTFQHYSQLTKLIQDFFIANLGDAPPMFQRNFDKAKFEFFQEAIVKGRLIHSSSKDSSKVTHPRFFNNLLKQCLPLDYFFELKSIDFAQQWQDEDPLFEFRSASSESFAPYVVIVDRRKRDRARLEIISPTSLESKAYEYGHSRCFYFEATPKWPNLNIEIFRNYFFSPVGEQIIELTFADEVKKAKANLSKLLVPKAFCQHKELPQHIERGFELLRQNSEQLLEMRPSALTEQFSAVERIIGDVAKNYPSATLGLLSNFSRSLQMALDTFGLEEKRVAPNFNNPIIRTPLVLSKTYSIYPDNPDVYLEFNNENSLNLIHSPLEKVRKSVKETEGISSPRLELYAQGHSVISIYSDEEMLAFLKFIFDNLTGMPLSQLLQGVAAPRLTDLKSILSTYNSLRKALQDLRDKTPGIFAGLINQTLLGQ